MVFSVPAAPAFGKIPVSQRRAAGNGLSWENGDGEQLRRRIFMQPVFRADAVFAQICKKRRDEKRAFVVYGRVRVPFGADRGGGRKRGRNFDPLQLRRFFRAVSRGGPGAFWRGGICAGKRRIQYFCSVAEGGGFVSGRIFIADAGQPGWKRESADRESAALLFDSVGASVVGEKDERTKGFFDKAAEPVFAGDWDPDGDCVPLCGMVRGRAPK